MPFSMLCDDRPAVGQGIHRAGWPWVREHLTAAAGAGALPLDDFSEVWFAYGTRGGRIDSYRKKTMPHLKVHAWCGVWHHPARVKSRLASDGQHALVNALRVCRASGALANMTHAVCMCPQAGALLQRECPGVKVLVVPHPTPLGGAQWNQAAWLERPQVFQSGFFLRDTRFIFRLDVPRRKRVRPYLTWHIARDRRLVTDGEVDVDQVRSVPRLDDAQYDEALRASMMVSHAFGSAANNVTIEAMAACAPLLTNRSAASEYYLGRDYPLLYDYESDAYQYARDRRRILAAHQHAVNRLTEVDLRIETFVRAIQEFLC